MLKSASYLKLRSSKKADNEWSTIKFLSTNSKPCAPNQAIYFDKERNFDKEHQKMCQQFQSAVQPTPLVNY